MDISANQHYERILLMPGEWYVTRKRVAISTLLGSCVSVCAYDALNGVVGMNHFLNSDAMIDPDDPFFQENKGHFGIAATDLLLDSMLEAGALISNIRVKIYGGASLMGKTPGKGTLFSIGKRNIECVTKYLNRTRIPIVKKDVGGTRGRQIYFFSDTFSVLMQYSTETRPQSSTNSTKLPKNRVYRYSMSA